MLTAVLGGRQSAERVVGALFVVIDHPPMGGLADIVEAGEEMLVEHFFPEGAVKAFYERVLVRLAGLDVLDRHAIALQPAGKCFAQELGPVVGTHDLRQAMILPDLLGRSGSRQRTGRFPGSAGGRCHDAPLEHVFSFDPVRLVGRPLVGTMREETNSLS